MISIVPGVSFVDRGKSMSRSQRKISFPVRVDGQRRSRSFMLRISINIPHMEVFNYRQREDTTGFTHITLECNLSSCAYRFVFNNSPMMCGVGLRPVFLSGADLKVRRLRGASTERRMRLCRRFHQCRSRSTDIALKFCANSFVHCKDVVSG